MNFHQMDSAGRRSRGFTLIEVMVVVIIIGILATLVVPRLTERTGQARITKAKHDINQLTAAIELYKMENFNYPPSDLGLEALMNPPPDAKGTPPGGRYVDRLPKDPWGNPYQYLNPGVNADIDIFTYGADGQPGGDGEAADIGNWNIGE